MATVYILKGSNNRHYIGSTENFERRFEEHSRGSCHTTKRLGGPLEIVVQYEIKTVTQARILESKLKKMKSPTKAIEFLNSLD